MNWISINPEKCNRCKLCVLICPRCFSEESEIILAQADITNCNICGHCIALCKSQAITHTQMNMENFLRQFHNSRNTLDIETRRKILHLIVKEVLVGPESITIRHSIPASEPSGEENTQSYLLCTRRAKPLVGKHRPE